jgi:hypothetical protein
VVSRVLIRHWLVGGGSCAVRAGRAGRCCGPARVGAERPGRRTRSSHRYGHGRRDAGRDRRSTSVRGSAVGSVWQLLREHGSERGIHEPRGVLFARLTEQRQ